jgi:nucleoside-diphosphate-sugar epimerase
MAQRLIALTGATGFLGRALARALSERGDKLRMLLRPGAAPPAPGEVVTGRLEDQAAIGRLVEGADLVIHAAGLVKARRPQDFEPVNVQGARDMAAATAERAPDARFLLISSLSAREPHLSPYAASKAEGEAAAREVLAAERLTVVRPPAIYGPGDRETLALFRAARSLPVLPLPGPEHARLALIHVADAAEQILALAALPCAGAVFALADARGEGYGWREIMQAAAVAIGRKPAALLPVPAALVLGLGAANSLAGRLGGEPRIMTLGKAREALHADWSVTAAERGPVDYACRFDLDSGFADSVAWYRTQGWL